MDGKESVMTGNLKMLVVEDVATDAELLGRELRRAGLDHFMARVETREDFLRTLTAFQPDIILCDFSMPHFDGLTALEIAREKVPHTPFIFVSGTIGEEVAIEAIKRGATDYVLKTNMARLAIAVRRGLQDEAERSARRAVEAELRKSQDQSPVDGNEGLPRTCRPDRRAEATDEDVEGR